MRLYGHNIWTNIRRYNKTTRAIDNSTITIDSRQYWDVNLQPTTRIHFTLYPGDQLHTHCVYDTTKSNSDIHYGQSTNDEICLHVLHIYPNIFIDDFICGYYLHKSMCRFNGASMQTYSLSTDRQTEYPFVGLFATITTSEVDIIQVDSNSTSIPTLSTKSSKSSVINDTISKSLEMTNVPQTYFTYKFTLFLVTLCVIILMVTIYRIAKYQKLHFSLLKHLVPKSHKPDSDSGFEDDINWEEHPLVSKQ
jgi:hypothetical protein